MIQGDNQEMSWRQVSNICKDILDQDGDIEAKDVIKNIIDFIFEAFSKKMLIFHIVLYIVSYFIPFVYQIHQDASDEEGQRRVVIALSIFMIT